MQVTIATPDAEELERETAMTVGTASAVVIVDDATFEGAAGVLRTIKGRHNELDALRKGITKPLDDAKKAVMNMFRTPLERLKNAENITKASMLTYTREQEAKRVAEEARLQEIARKEREKIERAAERAAKAGKEEKAEALEAIAEAVPVPVVAEATPKVAGQSVRNTYHAQVTDKMALIKAVAEGKAPDVLLEPNMTALNGQARALKQAMNYPGVQLRIEQTLSSRS
jgi:hypothetical protein